MKVFSCQGFKFYFLQHGEKLPNIYASGNFTGGYVIWPRNSGKWDVRYKFSKDWEEITDKIFDSENEAFQFAYEHYLNR
jgi:hypothetical protein